jgi:ABC-type phosphate transport system substrate-binding protein
MNRTRYSLPVAALLCAALLAGCGGGSSSSKSTATPAQSGSTASSQTSGSAPAAGSPQIKEAVARCKQIIQSESKLPASAKTKLEGACQQAAKGNTSAVKVVAREVCEEVINSSSVPNGSAKEAALKACRQ